MFPRRLDPTIRANLARRWRRGLPRHWSTLLVPAAGVYRLGFLVREAAWASGLLERTRLPRAVVSVGNLAVGGTGKTPVVEWIARHCQGGGRRVAVVSRGHGRSRGGPAGAVVVSDGTAVLATAEQGGDEPVLLARRLPGVPVVVAKDRAIGGRLAVERFDAEVLLLDDGFQQRRLRVDVDVVCLDGRDPWGHGLLPRGMLREPLGALRRAHLLVLSRADEALDRAAVTAAIRAHGSGAPMVDACLEAEALEDVRTRERHPLSALAGRPVLAFAGIAQPEGLVRLLTGAGASPRGLVAFPDHHAYEPADLARLGAAAKGMGAELLVTTEKDAVRLTRHFDLPVWALSVRLRLGEGRTAWTATLDRLVDQAASPRPSSA